MAHAVDSAEFPAIINDLTLLQRVGVEAYLPLQREYNPQPTDQNGERTDAEREFDVWASQYARNGDGDTAKAKTELARLAVEYLKLLETAVDNWIICCEIGNPSERAEKLRTNAKRAFFEFGTQNLGLTVERLVKRMEQMHNAACPCATHL